MHWKTDDVIRSGTKIKRFLLQSHSSHAVSFIAWKLWGRRRRPLNFLKIAADGMAFPTKQASVDGGMIKRASREIAKPR